MASLISDATGIGKPVLLLILLVLIALIFLHDKGTSERIKAHIKTALVVGGILLFLIAKDYLMFAAVLCALFVALWAYRAIFDEFSKNKDKKE